MKIVSSDLFPEDKIRGTGMETKPSIGLNNNIFDLPVIFQVVLTLMIFPGALS
jgi:hypothetical protein